MPNDEKFAPQWEDFTDEQKKSMPTFEWSLQYYDAMTLQEIAEDPRKLYPWHCYRGFESIEELQEYEKACEESNATYKIIFNGKLSKNQKKEYKDKFFLAIMKPFTMIANAQHNKLKKTGDNAAVILKDIFSDIVAGLYEITIRGRREGIKNIDAPEYSSGYYGGSSYREIYCNYLFSNILNDYMHPNIDKANILCPAAIDAIKKEAQDAENKNKKFGTPEERLQALAYTIQKTLMENGYTLPQVEKPASLTCSTDNILKSASSPHLNFLNQILAHAAMRSPTKYIALDSIADSLKNINRNALYRVDREKNIYSFSRKTEKESTTIAMNPETMNKAAEKLFVFIIDQIANHIVIDRNNNISNTYLRVSIKDFVKIGMYNSDKSAYNAIKSAQSPLTDITIRTISYDGRKKYDSDMLRPLFAGIGTKNGFLVVELNPFVDWHSLCRYYAITPPYAYSLDITAFRLMRSITYHARQRGGLPFKLTIKTVIFDLGLPSLQEASNPTTQIKQPILKAVGEILDKDKGQYFDISFNDTSKVGLKMGEGWAAESYLYITPMGSMAIKLQDISKTNQLKAENAIKTREKLQVAREKAIGKAIGEKISQRK